MSAPALRPLRTGRQQRLLARYRDAHRAFARGDFGVALERYRRLSDDLRPHFAAIVSRNIGTDLQTGGDLSDDEVSAALAGRAAETMNRLRLDGSEGKTASLCSAVAHDVALIARHLAEGQPRGRDPEVARAIIAGFAHAVAVCPSNPINYHNLAGYEDYLGLDAQACEHYRLALQLDQHQWESWISWGHANARLGDIESAEICWANALMIVEALDRSSAERTGRRRRNWAVAMLRLLKGDYVRGWEDYEARLTYPPYVERHGRPDLKAPLWDGAPIDGTVYLHAEQGVGDAIMMARYVPMIQERVGRVAIEVIGGLVSLFRAMFPELEIVAKGDTPPKHAAQLPMFSLPHLFATTLENVPAPVPFSVESAQTGPIQPEPGRIGLCWRGSATHPNDLVRSMPFEACFPLLDVPDLSWQSLQFGYDVSAPLEPLPPGDFLETARQIARCSLVITVDTSVAHLAGSMGVPCWVLLPYVAEWRWLQSRPDSPWYPSLSLWRQGSAGDWRGLVSRMTPALLYQMRTV